MRNGRQPKWDIYEAVILLDGYLEAQQGSQPKSHIVKRISVDLRRMALNRGIQIDDVYRNKNGISYQIQSMDSAYKGRTVYVPSTKLFDEVVDIYHHNVQRYNEMLGEAKSMVNGKQNNRGAFLSWATSVLPSQRCKWIEDNILKMEQLAKSSKLITGSIFEVSDAAVLESIFRAAKKNKIFQIKNRKFINNINEDFMAYMEFCSLKPETDKASVEPVVRADDSPNEAINTTQQEADCLIVDFGKDESVAFTKPISISIFGVELAKPSTWKDVYVSVVSTLYGKHADVFMQILSYEENKLSGFGIVPTARTGLPYSVRI